LKRLHIRNDGFEEWNTQAHDGEVAALLHMISHQEVEFDVDLSGPAAAQERLELNSKKADDVDIESVILVRSKARDAVDVSDDQIDETRIILHDKPPADHERTAAGDKASCQYSSSGPVDCAACLAEASASVLAPASPHERDVLCNVLETLKSAGWNGVSISRLKLVCSQLSEPDIHLAVEQLSQCRPPLIFWAGYEDTYIVHSEFVPRWTVSVENHRLFPRRWLDIKGRVIKSTWNASRRAVIGLVQPRPGICQFEIRQRLNSHLDKPEIDDLLQHLLDINILQRRHDSAALIHLGPVRAADAREARHIYWMTNPGHPWFGVDEDDA